jgi:hypothetical protein
VIVSARALLAPLFVEVALTLALLTWLGVLRLSAVRRGIVSVGASADGEGTWPAHTTLVQNAFRNQFQLPILFYLLVVLALVTGHTEAWLVGFSWVFVILRLLHALIHTTTNNVPRRFLLFTAGMIVLVVMWIGLVGVVYLGAAP